MSIKLGGFEGFSDYLLSQIDAIVPAVDYIVEGTAVRAAWQWRSLVAMSAIRSEVDKKAYMESITWKRTGTCRAEVSSDYLKASDYEKETKARDLKDALKTSSKVRIVQHGKNSGKRYLIIPFRHNVKSMPGDMYAKYAKQLSMSSVLSVGTRASGTGATVPQNLYKWGKDGKDNKDKATFGKLPAGLSAKLKGHHKTDIHAGMVRFNTSAGKGKSSKYLTFRVMGEWSNGWIVGAKPGMFIFKQAEDAAQKGLENAMAGYFATLV